MALPTVHYDEASAGTGSSLVSVWMPALHTLLVAAGWTQSYIDSDGIGGGSSGSPAWDKTPSANVDAGIVVYRMPANGHATQWYVRLRPGWAATGDRPMMRGVTVGTTHDGSGTVGGSEATPSVYTGTHNNYAWQASASEDGFFLALHSDSMFVHVERVRLPDGTVTDDIMLANKANSIVHSLLNAAGGEVTSLPPLVLSQQAGAVETSIIVPGATTGRDGSSIAVLGPYPRGGYPLFGAPRLFFLASESEISVGAERDRTVDGGAKTFKAWSVTTNNRRRLMVATE